MRNWTSSAYKKCHSRGAHIANRLGLAESVKLYSKTVTQPKIYTAVKEASSTSVSYRK